METYNTNMNRPAFMEPEGTLKGPFTLRLWEERPIHYATMLYEACAAGDLESVLDALRHGASPNVCDVEGRPLIHIAALKYSILMMEALQQFGASLDAQDEKQQTALHLCAVDPTMVSIAQWLLEMGADATIRDCYEKTAEHIALECGNDEVAEAIEMISRYN